MALQFVNAYGRRDSLNLHLQAGAGNSNCDICEYAIHGQCYRTAGHEYKICRTCFDIFVQPISDSNNPLDSAPQSVKQLVSSNVHMNVYNGMSHSLYCDLRGMGLTCNMCGRAGNRARWAYVNTYNRSVYACHITCVVQKMGANQRDDYFNYETNPFWKAVGRLSLKALQELANLAPFPFNSGISIMLMLTAYKVLYIYTTTT